MSFPNSVDIFKTIPAPTVTRTDTSDVSNDTLSQRLQQHSNSIATTQSYLLGPGKGLAFVGTDVSVTANVITVTLGLNLTSYPTGMELFAFINNSNTGSTTININGVGAVSVVTPDGNPLQGGELAANSMSLLIFTGSEFRIAGNCPLSKTLTGQSTNVSVECAGYTSIAIQCAWSSGSNLILTLSHLSPGVHITLALSNLTGSATTFSIAATTPLNASFTTINYILAGAATPVGFSSILAGTSSVTMNNSSSIVLNGAVTSPTAIYFSR